MRHFQKTRIIGAFKDVDFEKNGLFDEYRRGHETPPAGSTGRMDDLPAFG
jgi:hypothetical protein